MAKLKVCLVDYPAAVEYVVPPVSVVLAFGDHAPDESGLSAAVLRAAEKLALANEGNSDQGAGPT